jgi:hypothetical protein
MLANSAAKDRIVAGFVRAERPCGHDHQDRAARDSQRLPDPDQELRDGSEAEGRDRGVRGVGRCDPHPGDEPVRPAAVDGPTDDQQADRAQREGDGEADRQAADEEVRGQGTEVGADGPPVPISTTPVTTE